jgi:hypothetical protein
MLAESLIPGIAGGDQFAAVSSMESPVPPETPLPFQKNVLADAEAATSADTHTAITTLAACIASRHRETCGIFPFLSPPVPSPTVVLRFSLEPSTAQRLRIVVHYFVELSNNLSLQISKLDASIF